MLIYVQKVVIQNKNTIDLNRNLTFTVNLN